MKNKKNIYLLLIVITTCMISRAQTNVADSGVHRLIAFATTINPEQQVQQSKELAKLFTKENSNQWRSKGDQLRSYYFQAAGSNMPYRLYVPATWDGKTTLPLVVFLHGAWNDESSYVTANDKQMIRLAEQYGFILVSPLGYSKLGGYGNSLLLPALFGKPAEVTKIMASVTSERTHTLELSEMDVINVIELVLNEYPVNASAMYLTGHSMGSGGTLYIGAKYNNYWKALAPMSGPFVDEKLYPWNRISTIPVFISEGNKSTASLESSRLLATWMKEHNYKVEYSEVEGDHAGMVPVVLPKVFDFFNRCYQKINSK
ncbi:carboxylesterase family protein [Ferruginibacter sp.]